MSRVMLGSRVEYWINNQPPARPSLGTAVTDATPVLSLRELEAEITELVGHLNAAQHRWLTLIAEFDRRHGWNCGATKSCAHWLNYKCGIDLGAAREKVRVAHALAKLPAISAAMSCGQLSYSKVRALTRVACAATEAYFLDIALHGTAAHVEKLVRCYRRVQEVEELSREARQQANRSFAYYYDEDGSLVLKGRVPAEAGALLLRALESALPKPEPRSDRQLVSAGTFPQRRADALAEIAESFLKHGIECLN